MKKLLTLIFTLLLGGLVVIKQPQVVYADETETTETIEEEETETIEDFKTKIENKLSEYLDREKVELIIKWLIDSGVLVAMFGVYVKYKKYKNTTIDELYTKLKTELKDYLQENFKQMGADELTKVCNALKELETANETIMKVLVLMQDNTAKGRVALLEYLGNKTTNNEVKELTEEVNATIEKQQEAKQEIIDKVKNDYEQIF
jgi:hypothetical protein